MCPSSRNPLKSPGSTRITWLREEDIEVYADPERAWVGKTRRLSYLGLVALGLLTILASSLAIAFAVGQLHTPITETSPTTSSPKLGYEQATHTLVGFLTASSEEERLRYVDGPYELRNVKPINALPQWHGEGRFRSQMLTDPLGRLRVTLLQDNRPLVEACVVPDTHRFRILKETVRHYGDKNLDEWLVGTTFQQTAFRASIAEANYYPTGIREEEMKALTLLDVFSDERCIAYLPRYSKEHATLNKMLDDQGKVLPSSLEGAFAGKNFLSTESAILHSDVPSQEGTAPKEAPEAFVTLEKKPLANGKHYVVIKRIE